jgi:hypothetical protein
MPPPIPHWQAKRRKRRTKPDSVGILTKEAEKAAWNLHVERLLHARKVWNVLRDGKVKANWDAYTCWTG